ncbi:MAG: DivIVA domain-containing protein [Oscillospiraceae bacterium]|nr:DivIVA domain-containing protein [Oscillospiraceae bacterium]
MALDQSYFDAIRIETVRKKYYNANKVEALLADIRRRALELTEENERLRRELAQLTEQKTEIGDTLLSAKSIAQQMLQEAKAQADGIVSAAEERARELRAAAAAEEEAAVRRTEACYRRMRERMMSCVDALNADWQDYLCSLDDGEDAPADLDEKVGAIAREMFALDEETETAGAEL